MANKGITYLGRTNHRNTRILFGIRQEDRRSHMYICGKTGTGKSHLMQLMASQDISAGAGFAFIDPHGALIDRLAKHARLARPHDLILVEPFDPASSIRFNPLLVRHDNPAMAVSAMVDVFHKLWPDDWGPRLEHLLRNVLFSLLAYPGSTLADIPPLLTDRDLRKEVLEYVKDDMVRDFWKTEFERYSPAFRAVIVAPLQNKVGALLTDPNLRRFLTETGTQLDLARTMNEGRILLVNLDKGRLGEGPAALLGSLLTSQIAVTGLARSSIPEEGRRDFWFYLDEFQTFTTLALATGLSELRKYKVGLILAHQHLAQLQHEIRDAVTGNVGTMVVFRVGAQDASYFAREFAPKFDATDLISLPRYSAYVKLQIEGATSPPFSAETIDGRPEF